MDLKHYAKRYISLSAGIKKDWKYTLIDKLLPTHAKVLDIGCASGLFYDNRKHKHIQYSGIDYNPTMVEYCTKERGLDVKQCDLSNDKLPYDDNSFDFIYCSHVLEHLLSNEQISFFAEIQRVLKKDGVFLLFTPTPYHRYFWDDPTHQRASTHGSLEHMAKDVGLEVIESKYSNVRFFPQTIQTYLRLPPLRWFLWEVYLVAKK
ncbi:MAG: class I SAM-dependent methyltransferase [Candidatus Absconditabacterales bacterium]